MTVRISRRIVIIFNNVAAYYWTMTLTPALADEKNFLLRCHRKENDHTSENSPFPQTGKDMIFAGN
ncbi:hypothetical protein DMH27_16265 [Raoultella planticola]|nr:hypothetical protein [Raoultella planticola]